MMRLYLKAYKISELVDLYNALSLARSVVKVAPSSSRPARDLDDIIVYLSGYIEAREDEQK